MYRNVAGMRRYIVGITEEMLPFSKNQKTIVQLPHKIPDKLHIGK